MHGLPLLAAVFMASSLASPVSVKRHYVAEVEVIDTIFVTPEPVTMTAYANSNPELVSQHNRLAVISAPLVTVYATVWVPPSPVAQTLAIEPTTSVASPTPPSPTMEAFPMASDAAAAATLTALPTDTIVKNLQPTDPAYIDLSLYAHNVHRQNHTGTSNIAWNTTLASFAKEKAEGCIWAETLPDDAAAAGVGMNMAEGTFIGAANITFTIGDMWYNSELPLFPGYGVADPDGSNFNDWGHFTQVVWRATTTVGCWSAACARKDGTENEIGSGFFSVCMYYPPGNVPGEYAEQVGTPEGHPLVTGV